MYLILVHWMFDFADAISAHRPTFDPVCSYSSLVIPVYDTDSMIGAGQGGPTGPSLPPEASARTHAFESQVSGIARI